MDPDPGPFTGMSLALLSPGSELGVSRVVRAHMGRLGQQGLAFLLGVALLFVAGTARAEEPPRLRILEQPQGMLVLMGTPLAPNLSLNLGPYVLAPYVPLYVLDPNPVTVLRKSDFLLGLEFRFR